MGESRPSRPAHRCLLRFSPLNSLLHISRKETQANMLAASLRTAALPARRIAAFSTSVRVRCVIRRAFALLLLVNLAPYCAGRGEVYRPGESGGFTNSL